MPICHQKPIGILFVNKRSNNLKQKIINLKNRKETNYDTRKIYRQSFD